eukprot:CAMPEP_0206230964 /NCGR_PEP_ID=MMETSP0047_2-20121206/10570_1 /ASSEMBLY_ACC=CAM_ASM_000192 /TAXON_ID=195065 /ORGANISM="Chroomonas mesostigmatica_cf, Strain CCMP1168" /LENGTH=164 /DNA_ID=CAMNT_0053654483 /DNA_START=183 /DNA_END=673 /DNA_ORIENTATION=-
MRLRKLKFTAEEAEDYMETLEGIDASFNRLTRLPTSFSMLTSLRKLDLSHNRITYCGLQNPCPFKQAFILAPLVLLDHLNLGHNELCKVNKNITCLTNLVELYLDHNLIKKLNCSTFANLASLRHLDLSNNPLCESKHALLGGCGDPCGSVYMHARPVQPLGLG